MPTVINAAPPPLREQLSLNGTWNFKCDVPGMPDTMPVPEFWDGYPIGVSGSIPKDQVAAVKQATYERTVTVPAEWAGKRIFIEFEGVNYVATVYVNDSLAGSHVGGFVPFSFDITNSIQPGTSNTIRVFVVGGSKPPIVDAAGFPLWPVGWYGHCANWGISFDVYLRAYGQVYIKDAFIKTSYRKKTITVDYSLKNSTSQSKTVTISADAVNAQTKNIDKSFSSQAIILAAGESKTITVTSAWDNPVLWFPYPEKPQLYHLQSSLMDGQTTIDAETRRFGFREIWIDSIYYRLNGRRLNLFGENINEHCQHRKPPFTRPENWPSTVDAYFSKNIRYVRFHQAPADPHMIETCDEKGMLVLEESAIYARDYCTKINRPLFIENSKIWIESWVKARRNHPSIVQWSAENEMGFGLAGTWPYDTLKLLGDEIRKYDSTRPVSYDGDKDVGSDVVFNFHYPEGYENTWTESIYKLLRSTVKPCGYGEFVTDYGPNGQENRWMQGVVVRGLRYTNWADIRPYRLTWFLDELDSARVDNLKNGCAFVALFDKKYDSLGTAPVKNKLYPSLTEGATAQRTLVLYNDEFNDSVVQATVTVSVNGTVYATKSKYFIVPLGYHIDIPCSFQVPDVGGAVMTMTLSTAKQSVKKFEEPRMFNVTENGFTGAISKTITLVGGFDSNPISILAVNSRHKSTSLSVAMTARQVAVKFDNPGKNAMVSFYSITGRRLAHFAGIKDSRVTWDMSKQGNGAFIVSVVQGKNKQSESKTFQMN